MRTLAGKTLLISGASRGVGLAIALRAAQDGANICILAKTANPDPRLDGTAPRDSVLEQAKRAISETLRRCEMTEFISAT